MKRYLYYILLLIPFLNYSQYISVDSQSYSAQQLIEDILIDSECIENVIVTNVIGGDFNDNDKSYGFFDATNTSFPFQNGIVLSTGRLSNVEGPNTTLSDDDAPNWTGDNDLEYVLNETNTLNATILEFDFSSQATQVSFRYIFASEEYQENNPNTCQYSDLFGFLIKPINNQEYINIALIPNTQIPVKVTTVHPEIPNGCSAENEEYFESWNGSNAPINFNGQTKVLTATADIIPNELYHVKLVIADEQNYRYDSAVFLEAGSFELTTNLGIDRLISTSNPLCENTTITLNATENGNNFYTWYKNGNILEGQTNSTYVVESDGYYTVEVQLENNCISYGEIEIEYITNPIIFNSSIINCDDNQDGLTVYNLFESEETVTNNNYDIFISNFYTSESNAINNINEIVNPESYTNSIANEIVYARVENQFNCFKIAEITLSISNSILNIEPFIVCDDESNDGFSVFDLTELSEILLTELPPNSNVQFYTSYENALNESNSIIGEYINTTINSDYLFVRVNENDNCYAISTVNLIVNDIPELQEDTLISYCLNSYPDTITLEANIINSTNEYTFQWTHDGIDLGLNTSSISINETGNYSVKVMHFNGCSSIRNIEVYPSDLAIINEIVITEASSNNTVTIYISGISEYEYAIDLGPFQNNNYFSNVEAGIHTIYVRDINGCGLIEQEIAILGFPSFFTPNGDSYNDVWKPKAVNARYNSNVKIKIFNRFGKLLKELNPLEIGWDGTLNNEKLPVDDYWFLVTMPNGKEYRGHFALIR